jgi:hypothetical protein
MRRRFVLATALSVGLSTAVAYAASPHITKALAFPPGHDVPPQTEFAPDISQIIVEAQIRDIKPGDKVTATWIAEKTKGAPPNYKIDSATMAPVPGKLIAFTLSKPNAGFPVGDYRVDLSYNGHVELSQHFKVVAPG